jgi:hypothetical protein
MADNSEIPAPRIRYIALVGLATIGTGVVAYRYLEDWSWIDSLYFSVVTLATVGYGDLTPQSEEGRLFTVFYIVVGIGIFAAVINFLVKRGATRRIEKHLSKQIEKK